MSLKFEQVIPGEKFILTSDARDAVNIQTPIPLYVKINDINVVNLHIGYVATLNSDEEVLIVRM